MPNERIYIEDTIVASASGNGSAGVNVIRVSGPDTEDIASILLKSLPEPRIASYTKFQNKKKETIDLGIALYFPAPNSYTGESILELHAHGGSIIGNSIIEEIISLGARQAQPGEFTKRAYLNGKIDLTQAEAVADLINSGTKRSAKAAIQSLTGKFSNLVKSLDEQLTKLRLFVEASIDFPEEDIDFLADEKLIDEISSCNSLYKSLISGASSGEILRNGVRVAIIGLPNAGKSSLLNLLSGSNKAIVTDIAGTTRDILNVSVDIDGILFDFFDTAGYRETPEKIEAEGIKRTNKLLRGVDLAIWVHDISANEELDTCYIPDDLDYIVANNKIDLIHGKSRKNVDQRTVNISAQNGEGLENLIAKTKSSIQENLSGDGIFTARSRHIDSLKKSYEYFLAGKSQLENQRAGELFAEDIKQAKNELSEITGEMTSDELLGKIFSEFCIGK